MNSDVFFTIGLTHKICQDYAASGQNYIIISDGCSSALDTDYGSRLIVTAAKSCINTKFSDINSFLHALLGVAHTYCRTLDLPDESLSATLGIARRVDNVIITHLVGDGVIAGRRRDGTIIVYDYEFPSGAPYYLRYQLDSNIKQRYLNEFGDKIVKHEYLICSNGTVEKISETNYSVESSLSSDCYFHINDYESIAVFSDGVKSFMKQNLTETSKSSAQVNLNQIVKELLSFKNYNGEFVHRRCNRALKTFKDAGISNYDDLSVGVLSCNEE